MKYKAKYMFVSAQGEVELYCPHCDPQPDSYTLRKVMCLNTYQNNWKYNKIWLCQCAGCGAIQIVKEVYEMVEGNDAEA
jgi:uncharacterized Zn finger protein